MTKSDLKTGDIIKLRIGDLYLVFLDTSTGSICRQIDSSGNIQSRWGDIDDYNEDLTSKGKGHTGLDVIEIRRPEYHYAVGYFNECETIWKRGEEPKEEPKVFTKSQLEEFLGIKITGDSDD